MIPYKSDLNFSLYKATKKHISIHINKLMEKSNENTSIPGR